MNAPNRTQRGPALNSPADGIVCLWSLPAPRKGRVLQEVSMCAVKQGTCKQRGPVEVLVVCVCGKSTV